MKKYKLLGDGSYGCVIQPEVPCKTNIVELNKKNSKKQNVSKLFLNYDSENAYLRESKFAKLINKWDPESNYFVAPSKICNTSIREILKNPASKECYDMPYYSKREKLDTIMINQIIMPNFGIDLIEYLEKYQRINKKKFPLQRWIKLLKNILHGLMVLQKNKVLHLDIKNNNILYDEDKLRLIDFSLVTSMDKFYKNESNRRHLGSDYFPNPPEFLLLYNYYYHHCLPEKDCILIEKYLKTLQSFKDTPYNNFLKFYNVKDILIILNDLLEWIHTTDDWVDVLNQSANKIDIYQFGTVSVNIDHFLDYSSASHEEQVNYIHFIKCILHPDFRMRPTAAQAYFIYKDLFNLGK